MQQDTHKTIKVGFNTIVRKNDKFKSTFVEKIQQVNKIVQHATLFTKLFYLEKYQTTQTCPTLDRMWWITAFRNFYTCKKTKDRKEKNQQIYDQQQEFFNRVYSKTLTQSIPFCQGISTYLKYEAVDMVKNFENMIISSFASKLKYYISSHFDYSNVHGEQRTQLKKDLKIVFDDVIQHDIKTFKSQGIYLELVKRLHLLLPRNITKSNVNYDIKCRPWEYFNMMIELNLNCLFCV